MPPMPKKGRDNVKKMNSSKASTAVCSLVPLYSTCALIVSIL